MLKRITITFCCCILIIISSLAAQEGAPLFTTDFSAEEFAQRRAKAYNAMGETGVAVIQGANMPHGYVKFRQTNQFYYLCGIEAAHAYLVLDGRTRQSTIFLQPRNERRERVEGKMLSADDEELVKKLSGIEHVRATSGLGAHLSNLSEENHNRQFYTPFRPAEGLSAPRDMEMRRNREIKADPWDGRISREENFANVLKKALGGAEIKDFSPIIDALRLIKSPREIELIRTATRLSGLALMESMRSTKPGIYERELDAIAKFIFFKNGAQGQAYYSLVAGGTNSSYPHYHAGGKQLVDGELVLMDCAPDYGYYVTDVTRQWPVNGKFSPWQRELYGFYLACYRAILEEIQPNQNGKEIKQRAVERMEKILADTKFSKPEYEKGATAFVANYKRSVRSRASLGHWVGMAAHDVGAYGGKYLPGMVFTIEPALRIPEEKIYIRLEDMILITEDGAENMSEFVPMDMDAIEQLMQEGGMLQQDGKTTIPPSSE